MTEERKSELAKLAYEAFRTSMGLPLPDFHELSALQIDAWKEVAAVIDKNVNL